MGCGASSSNVKSQSDFVLISEQYDRQARANIDATVIPKEGNDYLAVVKALDHAASHILVAKKRSDDGSKDKDKKNKNSSNSKFNQLLTSRRVVQDEALGRTSRSRNSSSTKYSDNQLNMDNNKQDDIPKNSFGVPLLPHSEEALRTLPYNAKLCILRLIRHPISLVLYWQYLQYLDKTSAMNNSPNTPEVPKTDGALAQFKLTINENIPHQPVTAEDSPYEAVLLLFLQVDKLVRLGVVPPQMRNPFGSIVHCQLNDNEDAPEELHLQRNGSLPTLDQYIGAQNNKSSTNTNNTAFPENTPAGKAILIQRVLCSQYVVQASVVRSHRVFYETVLNQAQGIMQSFCIVNPLTHINNFIQDKFYAPLSLTKALGTVLSGDIARGMTHSLQNFIHTITNILNAVIAIDDQHTVNLRILDDFERRGGFTDPNSVGLVFTSVPSDGYYLDLDFYNLYLQSSYSPSMSEVGHTVAKYHYPLLANGAGMISSSTAAQSSPVQSSNGFGEGGFAGVVSNPPTSSHYSFQSTCSVPQTTYVPTAGIRLAREQLLAVLAAYTFSPFIKSHMFNTLKMALANSTTQNIVAAKFEPPSPMSSNAFRPSTVATLTTPRSNSIASLRQNSLTNAPTQASTTSVGANNASPPQMFLQDCVKYANIALWGGYGVQQCMGIGHGSMPLMMMTGQVTNYLPLQPITFFCNGTAISISAPMLSPRGTTGTNTSTTTTTTTTNLMSPSRRSSTGLPGISTQQAIQEVASTTPLGAIDVSRAIVTREITRAFSHAACLLPPQVGICVISLLTPSPNQHIWSKHNKNQPFAGMSSLNTLKVVYANSEFASLCGSHCLSAVSASSLLPSNSSYINSMARSSSAISSMRPSTSGGGTSSGLGYLSVLGREYQDLFLDDEDKDELLDDMTSLKTIHTFARLATSDGTHYTPVIMAMKPVYMRIKPSRQEHDKVNIGAGASVNLQANTNQSDQDLDSEGFDNAGTMYRSTYFSPMFYVCVAIRTNHPPVPYSRPVTPAHSTPVKVPVQGKLIAHNYARYSSVPALFEEKKKDKDRVDVSIHYNDIDDSAVNWYTPREQDDQVTALSHEHKQYILKSRWAHDSAFLNIFPDVHDVLF